MADPANSCNGHYLRLLAARSAFVRRQTVHEGLDQVVGKSVLVCQYVCTEEQSVHRPLLAGAQEQGRRSL